MSLVVGCCAGGDNRKWRRVSGHKYGLGGHGDMAGDTCHEGWGRGLVTLTRVTRGHQSRGQQHAVTWDNGDVTRCCCMHLLFIFFTNNTKAVHIQNDYDYKHNSRILSTSRPV